MNYNFRPIDNWPRQKNKMPKSSPFRSRYDRTLKLLEKELDNIDARKVVIQIDVPESQIRNDGLPYSKARPEFQGVILCFESRHGPLRYLTDMFNDWQENIRAIALALESLRKVDRYGITKRGEQYKGWKQLPAGDGEVYDVHTAAAFMAKHSSFKPLQIITVEGVRKHAYREAAIKLHPDKGGNKELFNLLQKAKELINSK